MQHRPSAQSTTKPRTFDVPNASTQHIAHVDHKPKVTTGGSNHPESALIPGNKSLEHRSHDTSVDVVPRMHQRVILDAETDAGFLKLIISHGLQEVHLTIDYLDVLLMDSLRCNGNTQETRRQ